MNVKGQIVKEINSSELDMSYGFYVLPNPNKNGSEFIFISEERKYKLTRILLIDMQKGKENLYEYKKTEFDYKKIKQINNKNLLSTFQEKLYKLSFSASTKLTDHIKIDCQHIALPNDFRVENYFFWRDQIVLSNSEEILVLSFQIL